MLYPDTDRMYLDAESPTLNVVYSAYAEFPSKSCIILCSLGKKSKESTSLEETKQLVANDNKN